MFFISKQDVLFILACNFLKSWQSQSTGCLSLYSSADSIKTDSESALSNLDPSVQFEEVMYKLLLVLQEGTWLPIWKKAQWIYALDKDWGQGCCKDVDNQIHEHFNGFRFILQLTSKRNPFKHIREMLKKKKKVGLGWE